MYSSSTTAKRAFLECRIQHHPQERDAMIAEINEGSFADVHKKDVRFDLEDSTRYPQNSTPEPVFAEAQHETDERRVVATYSGLLVCHALWPFEPHSNADIIIGIDDPRERYRLERVASTRLLLACADTRFIRPTDDEFIDVLARNVSDAVRTDRFYSNSV